MRKLLLLFILLHGSFYAFTQNNQADSLRQLLNKEKQDTNRVKLMVQLARIYLYSKPDTALLVASQALDLARQLNYKNGEAASLRGMSVVFMTTGNYPKALELSLQSLKIAEEIQDDRLIGLSVSSLSDVYFYQGDLKQSLTYAHRAMSMLEKLRDTARLINVIVGIGDSYEKTDQLDSALLYGRRGYDMAFSQNYFPIKGITLVNLGNVFLKLGNFDSAMAYYRKGIPYMKEAENVAGIAESALGMAKIFLQKKQADSCLYYAKFAFTSAKRTGFTDQVLAASKFLAEYYRSVRNIDSAYVYQSATIEAKDSLFSQQKINQFQSISYDETLRHQQLEEARRQAKAQLKQNAFIGGLVALLVIAFLLYRNNNQKRKANLLLQKQKDEINGKANELSVQKQNLETSYNNVELLGEIGRKITASLSVVKIIGTAYDNVNALMDASVFGIGIYNDSLRRIEFPATYENGEPLPFYFNNIDDKNRFSAVCFNSGEEIVIGDLYNEYKDHIEEVMMPHEGGQPVSLIFIPLTAMGKKLGVITVQSFQLNAYSDYHLFMLRNIAIYTAIALDNAESYNQLDQTVSSLRATQAQLVQSEKMASLGELTAGIAHEIQNPLNFVNNFSDVNKELLTELKDEINKGNIDEVNAIADAVISNEEKINHHGKRADAIVKGMLQHSRSGSGQKEPADINALSDEYLRLAYHGLRAKDKSFNATLKTDYDESVGKINIVPQDIGRVILNLITNAFYATAEKKKTEGAGFEPTVSIATKKMGDKIVIRVQDNGNGIPQNIIDKIFQPFFTTKPTGQGTGLGLSLAYDIVKAHGGELKVKTMQGDGSEFIIQIPNSN